MKILYGAPASVFVRKVRILLQEKNIPFVTESINPMLDHSDTFKSISPLKKIPVFKDEEYIIADSSAICAYIDAKYPYPLFYPKVPEALGTALWFEEYADTALFQAIAPCYYQTVLVPLYRNRLTDDQAIYIALTENLPPVANYLEKAITGKQYLVNDQLTIADIAVASTFFNMFLSGFPLNEIKWPYLSAYLNMLFQRESFISCVNDINIQLERISNQVFY